jgi:hypothetical protein
MCGRILTKNYELVVHLVQSTLTENKVVGARGKKDITSGLILS